MLDAHHIEMRRKDAVLISFFGGSIAMLILMLILLLAIPDGDDE